MKYILLIVFVLLSSIGFSQQSGNPFEVFHTKKYKETAINKNSDRTIEDHSKKQSTEIKDDIVMRLDTSTINNLTVDSKAKDSSFSTNNPFSVDHSSDVSTKGNNTSNLLLKEEATLISQEIGSGISNKDKAISPDNPFEVVSSDIKDNTKQKTTLEKSIERVESSPITKERNKQGSSFIFWIIFFTIFLFAILINYKRSFILKSYRGILNENYLKLIRKEESNGYSFFFISLFIVFLFSISSFIYLYLNKIQNFNIGFILFVKIFFGILIVYLLRSVFMRFIGYIFNLKVPIEKYFFTVIYFNILLGIALIAINIGFAFGSDIFVEYSFYAGVVLVVFSLLIRYLRGLLMSIQYNFLFKMQFIFYLCAVEIAPVFVILKLIESQNGSFL